MKKNLSILIALIIFNGCSNEQQKSSSAIDSNSYNLGIIGAFGELVNCGVKKIALSEALPPAEMDKIFEEAQKVAERNHVQLYRESDLIKTNLFPEDIAVGKDVLLIYQGTSLDEYLALKEEVKQLEKEGKYNGETKMKISRRFGRLLSYPSYRLNELLAENTSYRTMRDFGIKAGNVFFYYKNLDEAENFYTQRLGFEMVADYDMAKILRISSESYLILVDEKYGMHKTNEAKTVKLSLVTDQVGEWYLSFLHKINIQEHIINSSFESFSTLDPSGYTIEFISYKQTPANENIIAKTNAATPITSTQNKLNIKSSIVWLYYNDVEKMKQFYDETIGLKPVNENHQTKIYEISPSAMLAVTAANNEFKFSDKKAVNVAFILNDVGDWFKYCTTNIPFDIRSKEIEVGDEGKYKAFVGYDPEGYYLEFDAFYEHELNKKLMGYLK